MKWFFFLFILLGVFFGGFFLLNNYIYEEKQSEEVLVGGERTAEGCLMAAGYSFNETVGACIREWEMTPGIMEASKMAVESAGGGYAVTVVAFNSYEEEGSYDIFLERGEERIPEVIYIRNSQIVPSPEGGSNDPLIP